MHFGTGKIEAVKQENEHLSGAQAEVWLSGSRVGWDQHGFTLIELIMVLIIVGILAVFAAPRLFDSNVFQSRGFADQVQSSLRYAQKEAVAQRRFVCAALASNSITLTTGATGACVTNLISLVGQPSNCPSATYKICAPSGITLTSSPVAPPVSFNFDAVGATAVQQTITVNGATNNIVVEAVTGYVHSP